MSIQTYSSNCRPGISARSCLFKRRALAASKSVRSPASLLHACRGRELSLHSGHGLRRTHTHSKHTLVIEDKYNGVCECGGAAPGSAQTGLGTAPVPQTDQRQEENHPPGDIIQGEDDVQEKLRQQRGDRISHC